MDKTDQMKSLIERLNEASMVYYQGQDEIMSNYEYDKLYDELVALEEETGIVMSNSPTIHVGYETISELTKEEHVTPMLSLNKTKDVSELIAFAGDMDAMLSMKLDGLSIILTYEGGRLTKALTRGNGQIGEVITNNAKTFVNLPHKIAYTNTLILRGEALILYSDFEDMNRSIDVVDRYKNPRNLCSGSVRQLNNEITAARRVRFYAYNIISASDDLSFDTRQSGLEWLRDQGFDIVPYKMVTRRTMDTAVAEFSEEVKKSDLPSDGLVLAFDDLSYSQSLGQTAKYPKDSIAFKWQDELANTTLRSIEWSASRTGRINPIAVFDPVELEGTTVTRASVHNISILKELELGVGDQISVYKANMIIPQIYENNTRSAQYAIPEYCPVCHHKTKEQNENGSIVLICPNNSCYAKKIKQISHFVSRDAMNIDGLSEATLEKFINKGFVHSLVDLYKLDRYKDEIINMEGFGVRSYDNLLQAVEHSKQVPVANFIYSLGIKGIGLSMAKLITNHFSCPVVDMKDISKEELAKVDGIGYVLAISFVTYFADDDNYKMICDLDAVLDIQYPIQSDHRPLEGLTFVITGSLTHFSNRNACKDKIESIGGKVAGSVSSKTDYLVNNDTTSQSSKNKKAKELNIPIISEEELLQMLDD